MVVSAGRRGRGNRRGRDRGDPAGLAEGRRGLVLLRQAPGPHGRTAARPRQRRLQGAGAGPGRQGNSVSALRGGSGGGGGDQNRGGRLKGRRRAFSGAVLGWDAAALRGGRMTPTSRDPPGGVQHREDREAWAWADSRYCGRWGLP